MKESQTHMTSRSKLNVTVIESENHAVSTLLLHRGEKVFFEVSVHAPNETEPRLRLSSDQGYQSKDKAIDEARKLIKLKQQEIDAALEA